MEYVFWGIWECPEKIGYLNNETQKKWRASLNSHVMPDRFEIDDFEFKSLKRKKSGYKLDTERTKE